MLASAVCTLSDSFCLGARKVAGRLRLARLRVQVVGKSRREPTGDHLPEIQGWVQRATLWRTPISFGPGSASDIVHASRLALKLEHYEVRGLDGNTVYKWKKFGQKNGKCQVCVHQFVSTGSYVV